MPVKDSTRGTVYRVLSRPRHIEDSRGVAQALDLHAQDLSNAPLPLCRSMCPTTDSVVRFLNPLTSRPCSRRVPGFPRSHVSRCLPQDQAYDVFAIDCLCLVCAALGVHSSLVGRHAARDEATRQAHYRDDDYAIGHGIVPESPSGQCLSRDAW